MKLFGRTGGYYLFWTGAVYLLVGFTSAFYFKEFPKEIIQIAWITVLALPFTYPPLGRYFNLDIEWDRKMFGWRKRQIAEQVNKDINESDDKEEVKTPEKDPTTFYRIGLTDNNRVSFQMGYSEITMTREGCQSMINMIATARDQLQHEAEDNKK